MIDKDENDDLAAVMKKMTQLHEPAPPASLRATVMARIARDADRPNALDARRTIGARRQDDRPVWLWTLATGLAIVICASAYGWLESGSLPDFTSPRIGRGVALILIPMEGPTALVIGLGLLVYMAGLVAPLRSGDRR